MTGEWYATPNNGFFLTLMHGEIEVRMVTSEYRTYVDTLPMSSSEFEFQAAMLLLRAAQEQDFVPLNDVPRWFESFDLDFYGLLHLQGEPVMAVTSPELLGICLQGPGRETGLRGNFLLYNTRGVVFVGDPRRKTSWEHLTSEVLWT